MEKYELKSEFHRRLVRVHKEIDRLLMMHCDCCVPTNCTNLLPALFSLYTFMWCKRWKDMIKRV